MLLAVAVLTALAAILSTIRGLAPATVSVVVAKKDLTPGTALGSSNLTVAEVSAELAPEGTEIAPVIADVSGADKFLTPGRTVALYAPPREYSKDREAVKIVDKATIVGVGPKNESTSFVSDSSHTSVLYVAVPKNTTSLVIGYGSTMPMRVVVVR